MNSIALLTNTLATFMHLYYVLIIRILLTWFPISWYNQPFSTLSQLTDYLNLFRSIIPPLGGIDISPSWLSSAPVSRWSHQWAASSCIGQHSNLE